MGYIINAYGNHRIGGVIIADNNIELIMGSLSVSEKAHAFLVTTVYSEEPTQDAAFTSIVEAFRFAFALGYSKELKEKAVGITKTVSPRQFTVMDYVDILEDEISKEYSSLGGLASAYAEAGAGLMMKSQGDGKTILSLLD